MIDEASRKEKHLKEDRERLEIACLPKELQGSFAYACFVKEPNGIFLERTNAMRWVFGRYKSLQIIYLRDLIQLTFGGFQKGEGHPQ